MTGQPAAYISVSPDGAVSSLHVEELDFVGKYVTSPDGQYIFAWGHRKYEYRVVLVHGATVVWHTPVPDCWRATVSNNGYSATLYGLPDEHSSVLHLYDNTGRILCQWRFTYAYYVVISPDGDFLCFNTGSGETAAPADAYSLCVFAISDGQLQPQFQTKFDGYELQSIRVEGTTVIVRADNGSYVYSREGDLLNSLQMDYHNAKLAQDHRNASRIFRLPERRLSQAVGQLQAADKEFFIWALQAVTFQEDASRSIRAKAARMLGELAVSEGDLEGARAHLSLALKLHSGCGAKRLLQRLEP